MQVAIAVCSGIIHYLYRFKMKNNSDFFLYLVHMYKLGYFTYTQLFLVFSDFRPESTCIHTTRQRPTDYREHYREHMDKIQRMSAHMQAFACSKSRAIFTT